MSFHKLQINEGILAGLKKEHITTPTKVQREVFSPIMEGENIAVQSETGSGKTLAYLLPIAQKMLSQKAENKVLILTPTHELALQVTRQLKRLLEGLETPIGCAVIVGNVNIKRQIENLKKKPQIMIGTTGRILELIQKKKIAAHLIETVVIDEADKMLDVNQFEETQAVLKKCMRNVQKLFFSASIPDNTKAQIERLAENVRFIYVEHKRMIPKSIHHLYIVCEKREKLAMLRSLISAMNPKKAIVFINRAYDIEEATEKLKYHHYQCECIHGKEKKHERKQVIEKFQRGNIHILIGTDMAARGLHFDDVEVVVHYSIPEDTKDYLHRAGRCGRCGKDGISISIVTKSELAYLRKCQKEFGISMQECELKKGLLLPAEEQKKAKKDEKNLSFRKLHSKNK